ncbi:MAG TPA: hypothetical protein VNH11_13045 [Pirellulales bacterium]|nr:hypothetical protein [Pirellulales bacterium]
MGPGDLRIFGRELRIFEETRRFRRWQLRVFAGRRAFGTGATRHYVNRAALSADRKNLFSGRAANWQPLPVLRRGVSERCSASPRFELRVFGRELRIFAKTRRFWGLPVARLRCRTAFFAFRGGGGSVAEAATASLSSCASSGASRAPSQKRGVFAQRPGEAYYG